VSREKDQKEKKEDNFRKGTRLGEEKGKGRTTRAVSASETGNSDQKGPRDVCCQNLRGQKREKALALVAVEWRKARDHPLWGNK